MTYYDKWKQEYGLEYLRRFAEDGMSDSEIAESIGIKPAILRRWKKKYPEVNEAINLGRIGADFAVVEALYKKATGYNVRTNKTHKLKCVDFDPVTGKKVKEYESLAVGVDESYVPPDLKAEIFWLKNRQPYRWNEKDAVAADEAADEVGVVEIPVADRIGGAEGEGDG